MELSIIVAVCAIMVTALAVFIDAIQTRSIRKINSKVEAFEQSDIGEQFGEWLLAKEDEDKADSPTNLACCARVVGHEISSSFSMGLKGIASGESRTLRSVEQKVLEGLETPESKALMGFVDRIGIDRELAGVVLNVLQSRGLLDQVLKKDGGGGSSSW